MLYLCWDSDLISGLVAGSDFAEVNIHSVDSCSFANDGFFLLESADGPYGCVWADKY